MGKINRQSQVRIRGKVAVKNDEAIQQRFREGNPMIAKLLPEETQHLFRLYRLQPEQVEMAAGLASYTEVSW